MQIQRFFQNPLNDFNQMKISIGELLNLSNEYEISFDLFYKINGLKYNIQRDYCWSMNQQVQWIKSWFQQIMFGVFVFAYEKSTNKYYCIDGKQRFKAMHQFINDGFPISVDGQMIYWKDIEDKNVIKRYTIQMYEIEVDKISPRQMAKVFLTLNYSGVPQDNKHLETLMLHIHSTQSMELIL